MFKTSLNFCFVLSLYFGFNIKSLVLALMAVSEVDSSFHAAHLPAYRQPRPLFNVGLERCPSWPLSPPSLQVRAM